jgi:hypothetical protein
MDSNRERRGKEEGRREDEEGNRGTSDEQAGNIFVFSPIPRRSNNSNRRSRIDRPEQFDVLCGRGKPIQKHPGNVILHRIIDKHRERYQSAPRLRKRGIVDEIVQAIKKSKSQHEQQLPGRFIRREQGNPGGVYWKEISDDAARDKVSHCFRARRHLTVIEENTSTWSQQLSAAGAVAAVIPPALSTADNIVCDRSFAVMNEMEPSALYHYLQQQHHQSQTISQPQGGLGENGGYHQQSSLQMLANYYAYHGAPLLGVGIGPPHGTTRDPTPATPQQEEGRQGNDGQQSMVGSGDQQATPRSAEEEKQASTTRRQLYQGPPSQGGGREKDSTAN